MRSIPESTSLLFDIWTLSNVTHAVLDEALRASGLSANEFAIYSVLQAPDGRSPGELAYAMQLPPTTVSSVVRRLERRGHVLRKDDPADGRSYRLHLSAAGKAVLAKAKPAFTRVVARVEGELELPVAQARAVLDQIDHAVRAAGS